MNKHSKIKVSAIVPAYNEDRRIRKVLDALTRTKVIDEIIVVDDGSADKTGKIVKQFEGVKYIKNARNRGKAYSMDKGVKMAKGEIIFFSDADLSGLTPSIIEDIVLPVIEGRCVMSIGIRNNIPQKIFLPFALNSGERALPRYIWEELPDHYKKGFRIEIGLNYFVHSRGDKICYKVFPYYQEIKEKKWGFWRGFLNRLKMSYDVIVGFILFHFYDRLNYKKASIKRIK